MFLFYTFTLNEFQTFTPSLNSGQNFDDLGCPRFRGFIVFLFHYYCLIYRSFDYCVRYLSFRFYMCIYMYGFRVVMKITRNLDFRFLCIQTSALYTLKHTEIYFLSVFFEIKSIVRYYYM